MAGWTWDHIALSAWGSWITAVALYATVRWWRAYRVKRLAKDVVGQVKKQALQEQVSDLNSRVTYDYNELTKRIDAFDQGTSEGNGSLSGHVRAIERKVGGLEAVLVVLRQETAEGLKDSSRLFREVRDDARMAWKGHDERLTVVSLKVQSNDRRVKRLEALVIQPTRAARGARDAIIAAHQKEMRDAGYRPAPKKRPARKRVAPKRPVRTKPAAQASAVNG